MRTGGRSGAKQFSILVQLKGAPHERAFAEKSLPPAATLSPDKIVVGVDGTDGDAATRFVGEVCRQHGFCTTTTIARVEWSGTRGFYLASVVWHCYKALCDVAGLVFGIDAVLHTTTMRGPEQVDSDESAAVSITKRILTRNISECMRLASLRVRAMTGASAFAGLHWRRLPHCFASVREERNASIANGPDDSVVMTIKASGTHKAVTLPDIGEDLLDLQNSVYPWRQFGDGIRHGTSSRACGGRCALPLPLPPRRPRTSTRTPRGGDGGPCRTLTRRHAGRGGGARSPGGSRSTNRRASETSANGTAGGRGLTSTGDGAVDADRPARSVTWGCHRQLANVSHKGINGRRHPHYAVSAARRRVH